jgi:pimeloyl-ACP methyl ester carboxylesterase
MQVMASQRGAPEIASDLLSRILDRYDPAAFDVPNGHPRVRLLVHDGSGGEWRWDAVLDRDGARLVPADGRGRPDALLSADLATWRQIADNVRAGLTAYRAGRLTIRYNLPLAVGLLAATSTRERGRLEVHCEQTSAGRVSTLQAGIGDPVVMIHGLGATKASFLPTIAALAPSFRTIAVDLPGFGDAAKPLRAAYDAPFFARSVVDVLDTLGLPRVHLVGHSLGGRVALEVAMRQPERLQSVTLMMPSMAWRRTRRWAPYLRLVRPELGILQPVPRAIADPLVRHLVPGADTGWGAVAVDEFLRGFLDRRGRAAFYAAARSIYLEEPGGPGGFWARLPDITTPSLFIWGRRDQLVPAAFGRHVHDTLPTAQHVTLDCGHVPQLECPAALHTVMRRFLVRHPLRAQPATAGAARLPSVAARH